MLIPMRSAGSLIAMARTTLVASYAVAHLLACHSSSGGEQCEAAGGTCVAGPGLSAGGVSGPPLDCPQPSPYGETCSGTGTCGKIPCDFILTCAVIDGGQACVYGPFYECDGGECDHGGLALNCGGLITCGTGCTCASPGRCDCGGD
jgi:hypothetical protein